MATNEGALDNLLNSVIQGEASDESKAECLRLAIQQNNQTAIQTLLDLGADPYFILLNKPHPAIFTIFEAVNNYSDNVECLKLLLEYQSQKKIGLTNKTKSRKTKTEKQNVLNQLLVYASAYLNSKCVRYLLEKGACVNYQENTYWRRTPLIAACSYGELIDDTYEPRYLQTVDILLNHGANTLTRGAYRRTALHRAADRGLTSVINRLLAAGCEVNMQDEEQCTPLIVLVRNYRTKPKIEAIKMLLKFGATIEYVNNENNSISALFHADSQFPSVSHNEDVELFLQEGADPDFKDIPFPCIRCIGERYVHTCLLTKAIDENNVTAVKLLIQYNCDVNSTCSTRNRYGTVRCRDGETVSAFRLAAGQESTLVMCKMLALAGCDCLEMNKCITEFDSTRPQSANAHLWQGVKEIASSPFTLEQLSRQSIRHHLRHIGCRIRKVYQLPLPTYLQEYLMFKELDYCINV